MIQYRAIKQVNHGYDFTEKEKIERKMYMLRILDESGIHIKKDDIDMTRVVICDNEIILENPEGVSFYYKRTKQLEI